MLLRLIIINQQLSILPKPLGFISSDFDGGEVGVAFAKNGIHFFEGAIGGFGVEEVDDWEDECVSVGEMVISMEGDGGIEEGTYMTAKMM